MKKWPAVLLEEPGEAYIFWLWATFSILFTTCGEYVLDCVSGSSDSLQGLLGERAVYILSSLGLSLLFPYFWDFRCAPPCITPLSFLIRLCPLFIHSKKFSTKIMYICALECRPERLLDPMELVTGSCELPDAGARSLLGSSPGTASALGLSLPSITFLLSQDWISVGSRGWSGACGVSPPVFS